MSEIFLVGRPNVGKSFLFNRLTNSNQKIANFAGVTVEKKSCPLKVDNDLIITDLPGIYSLSPSTEDERISIQNLKESSPEDLICLVIESIKVKSQVDFLIHFIDWCSQLSKPLIICINMKDEAEANKININSDKLQKVLNLPVFYVSAKTNEGVDKLNQFLLQKNWSAPETRKNLNLNSENIKIDSDRKLKDSILDCINGDFSNVLKVQNRFDQIFLHPIFGPLLFFSFTFILFQSIFSWAEPFMNLIENGITNLSSVVSPLFTGQAQSFVDNAIFAGFGAFLVFTPQIFILTVIITFLERSGYMTRAILICHQPLSWFGLHGKSFIPLMSGHACAVPAIYSTRTIENDWIRKLTIFILPLTACSARLPVYALLIQLLIPNKTIFFGLFGTQGLMFFLMYFFGIFMALILSLIITRFSKVKNVNDDFIIELPKYRLPELKVILSKGFKTAIDFIKDAGPTIFVLNAVIWVLSTYPLNPLGLKGSYMAKFGQFLEPIFKPIGLDWIQGIAVLSSFVAREIFVSTLGLLYGLSDDQSENIDSLTKLSELQDLSFASGFSLLIFFAIALQCMSTISVIRKEGGKKMAYTALLFYLILGYGMAFVTYQVLNLI